MLVSTFLLASQLYRSMKSKNSWAQNVQLWYVIKWHAFGKSLPHCEKCTCTCMPSSFCMLLGASSSVTYHYCRSWLCFCGPYTLSSTVVNDAQWLHCFSLNTLDREFKDEQGRCDNCLRVSTCKSSRSDYMYASCRVYWYHYCLVTSEEPVSNDEYFV